MDVISSYIETEQVDNVHIWDKIKKQKTEVQCPDVIRCYNKQMGGVNLLDCLTVLYKDKIKSRCW